MKGIKWVVVVNDRAVSFYDTSTEALFDLHDRRRKNPGVRIRIESVPVDQRVDIGFEFPGPEEER